MGSNAKVSKNPVERGASQAGSAKAPGGERGGSAAGDSLFGELERLAQALRILEMEGHGDMTLGHMSLRDPTGRGLWIKRNAIGLGEVRGLQDFVLIDFDGRQLEGAGRCHSEWPIHAEIMKRRPEVTVVTHTHPRHVCVFSATHETLRPVTMEGSYFPRSIPRHTGSALLVNTPALGADLAASLGEADAVIMDNHGLTFCGPSVAHATFVGIMVDRACRVQLALQSAGIPWHFPDEGEAAARAGQIMTDVHVRHCWDYWCRKLAHLESLVGGPPIFPHWAP